jgi:hypothetical protein
MFSHEGVSLSFMHVLKKRSELKVCKIKNVTRGEVSTAAAGFLSVLAIILLNFIR